MTTMIWLANDDADLRRMTLLDSLPTMMMRMTKVEVTRGDDSWMIEIYDGDGYDGRK